MSEVSIHPPATETTEREGRESRQLSNAEHTARSRWESGLTFGEMKRYLRLRDERPELAFVQLTPLVRLPDHPSDGRAGQSGTLHTSD